MKIAYIVPYVPDQIRTRSFNLISHLSRLGHEVQVFTVGSNASDRNRAMALRSNCAEVIYFHQPLWRSLTNSLRASLSGNPLQSVYSWQPQLAKYLVNLFAGDRGSQFDIIHVEHLRGSQYGVLLKSTYPNRRIVWDSVDCISHLFQQASLHSVDLFGKLVTRFELERTRKLERSLLTFFDHTIVTSPTDRQALLDLMQNGLKPSPISIVENGVDEGYFRPKPTLERDPSTVVFSGKMSYHANIAMAKYLAGEIMPRIWRTCPSAHLYIVGKDPPSDIEKWGSDPRITVTGTVDDLRPFLWRATVAAVPLLYGAGIQNKILEAMAAQTPVVTTNRALSALHVQDGKELLVADGAEEFSKAVVRLIDNKNLQRQIGNAGAAYVRTHHDWSSIASRLTDLYQQTIKPALPH